MEFLDVTDEENRNRVSEILIKEMRKLIKLNDKKDHVLVIGLGNDKSTPDSLGPLVINQIIVTNHLYEMNMVDSTYQRISAFNPSVMGKTGIETSDILLKLIELLKPKMVVVIDALASNSISRVNKTIQMTDTGIHPGSGIGNKRKEISQDILGIPVIAIGVPTVVDAVTIVSDTINFLTQHYFNTKNSINDDHHLYSEIPMEDKENLLGLIGTLEESELKTLFNDVLTPVGYNLMVTPKEVDFIVEELSKVLANSLNRLFHNR
jgi:spore protease